MKSTVGRFITVNGSGHESVRRVLLETGESGWYRGATRLPSLGWRLFLFLNHRGTEDTESFWKEYLFQQPKKHNNYFNF